MKNIKDIVIGIFAVIGVLALVTGFTNNTENIVQTTTPESHVWSFHTVSGVEGNNAFAINKVTGEVRKYETTVKLKKAFWNSYFVAINGDRRDNE